MRIVITIPAYNEENHLGQVLTDLQRVTSSLDHDFEYQVVDDGSTDNTTLVAKKHGAKVYSHKRNRGLAKTFVTELSKALEKKPDIIIHTDADGQYSEDVIPALIAKIQEGYDLVLASRFLKSTRHMPLFNKLGNILFSKVLSRLTGHTLTDTTTGCRAFTAEVARDIHFTNTFTYTQEQIIRASLAGFRIAEVPVQSKRTRQSKLFKNPFQYAVRAWINTLRIYRDYAPLTFFGSIGLTLFSLGVLLGTYIVAHIIIYGSVGGIPRTILSALLILSGMQIILFGFLADNRRT